MGVEKYRAEVDVDERKALRDLNKVERELNEIEREAKETQQEVGRARRGGRSTGLRGRFQGLLAKAKARGFERRDEDITLGHAFKFGQSGFSVRETFRKGQGEAAIGALNTAFWAGLAMHGTANALERTADLRRALKGLDAKEALSKAAEELPQILLDAAQAKTAGRIVKGGFTTITGDEFVTDVKDSFFGRLNYALSEVFGYDNSLDNQLKRQREDRQRFLQQQAQEALDKAKEEARDDAYRKLDKVAETQLKGLKTQVYRPKDTRLPRVLAREANRDYREAKAAEIREKHGLAKEEVRDLLEMEGR